MNIKEVIEHLDGLGVNLSERTIRNYESWEIIPNSTKTWLGRGKGSDVQYADDTPQQIFASFVVLKFRTIDIEQLKHTRILGLRLLQEQNLIDAISSKQPDFNENEFYSFIKKIKEKVFFDISYYHMLYIYGNVDWWVQLYLDADKVMRGESLAGIIPASKRLSKFDIVLGKLLGQDDHTRFRNNIKT